MPVPGADTTLIRRLPIRRLRRRHTPIPPMSEVQTRIVVRLRLITWLPITLLAMSGVASEALRESAMAALPTATPALRVRA